MTDVEIANKLSELSALRVTVSAISFPDADRDTFRKELITLTDNIIAKVVPTNDTEREAHVNAIKIATLWNEMLRDSEGYRLCPEMSYVVSMMIETLDPDVCNKTVVFTLGSYGIHKFKKFKRTNLVEGLIYLGSVYKIRFTKEPVFIRVPDEFKDDILSNIVLFHEVGHFVINNYAILDYVYEDVDKEINGNTKARILRDNFPPLYNIAIDEAFVKMLQSHIEEYIADIIGCAYSGKHILNFAWYLQGNNPKEHDEAHPSISCRQKMIDEFVYYCKHGKTSNHLLGYIISAIENNTSMILSIRQPCFSEDSLLDGTSTIDSIDTMLSMFITPWDMIIRERDAKKMKKTSVEEYNKLRTTQLYQQLDSMHKNMINTYMAANP